MADGDDQFFFYFAYGSNLLRERVRLANPSACFTAMGCLADYKLIFVGHDGRSWQGAAANIQHRQGSEVWGVVWRMDIHDLASLDDQEVVYTPMEVQVRAPQGELFRCRTYQLRLGGAWAEPNLPSPHYKDVIVRGARQNHLPEHYVKELEGVADNGYQGRVAVYDAVLALLSGSTE